MRKLRLPLLTMLAVLAGLSCAHADRARVPEGRTDSAERGTRDSQAAPTAPTAVGAGREAANAATLAAGAASLRPAGELHFLAVGDTGMANEGQFRVGAAMARACAERGCDFVLLLGDNFYESGVASDTDPQWQEKFEKPYAGVNAPFYASLGNHDYGNEGIGDDFGRAANEVAYSRKSTKWRMPAPHYHLTLGAGMIELFALDTNLANWGRDEGQKDEVAGWMRGSSATWKIAFGHHPYLSNGPHGNAGVYDGKGAGRPLDGALVKDLLESAVCGKANLYLCGHDHSRQWHVQTCNGTELAVSGGGSEGTTLPGRNPTRFQSRELGFLFVTVTKDALTAEFLDANGKVEFTRTLRKGAP